MVALLNKQARALAVGFSKTKNATEHAKLAGET